MTAPLGTGRSTDPQPPTVSITAPANNAAVNDIVSVAASASDNVGVAGVQFQVDGADVGVEDTQSPYAFQWDTRSTANGPHTLTARARDAAGNVTMSTPVSVNVTNTNSFQNDILATGFDLPTAMTFLPDGRLLIGELQGTIKVLSPPYTQARSDVVQPDHEHRVGGRAAGDLRHQARPQLHDQPLLLRLLHAGTPNRDRLSRFTANAALNGTVPGSELVLYQDPQDANAEHHGGAVMFGNDGKIYFTTGEHFNAPDAQSLTNPARQDPPHQPRRHDPDRQPVLRRQRSERRLDLGVLGLRNPYRAYYDAPTGRMFVGDVGGNVIDDARRKKSTSVRAAPTTDGPNFEGNCPAPCTSPLYTYDHTGDGTRHDAAITGGFVYHGAGAARVLPQLATRAATSSATTPSTGSSASRSTATAT